MIIIIIIIFIMIIIIFVIMFFLYRNLISVTKKIKVHSILLCKFDFHQQKNAVALTWQLFSQCCVFIMHQFDDPKKYSSTHKVSAVALTPVKHQLVNFLSIIINYLIIATFNFTSCLFLHKNHLFYTSPLKVNDLFLFYSSFGVLLKILV